MIQHELKAQKRTLTGRKVKSLRQQGLIPANIYGKKTPSLSIQLETKSFTRFHKEVGESTLIYLQIESEKEPFPVFIHDVVHHPVTGLPLHVTFHQVNLKEKVIAPVKLGLVGESPAEKDKLGILVQQLDEVEIEALPADMPEEIPVDVSSLSQVDAAIYTRDLHLPSQLTLKTLPDTIIAKIEPLAAEEVEEKPAEETPLAEGETSEETAAASPPAPTPESKSQNPEDDKS